MLRCRLGPLNGGFCCRDRGFGMGCMRPTPAVDDAGRTRTPCTLRGWTIATGFGLDEEVAADEAVDRMLLDRWISISPSRSSCTTERCRVRHGSTHDDASERNDTPFDTPSYSVNGTFIYIAQVLALVAPISTLQQNLLHIHLHRLNWNCFSYISAVNTSDFFGG